MSRSEPMPRWPEVESRIHRPGLWLLVLVGAVFCGIASFLALVMPPPGVGSDLPHMLKFFFTGAFAAAGMLALGAAVCQRRPSYIRHADASLFPQLSRQPILQEGTIYVGWFSHQLFETDDAWLFRPDPAMQRGAKRLMFWFGVPFCVGFASLLAWVFQRDNNTSWFTAMAAAAALTAVCGGSVLGLCWWIMQSQFQSLASLIIPKSGAALQIELPKLPSDPLRRGQPQLLKIPRQELLAVQLCPCVCASSDEKTWAVQGLLIVADSDAQEPRRIPILLNGDLAGTARLFKQLATILDVPFLFHADEAGWREERQHAKSRVALKSGGMS